MANAVLVTESKLVKVEKEKAENTLNLAFERRFKNTHNYYKNVDLVYTNHQNFTTQVVNYEIKNKDIEWLEDNEAELKGISYDDFEKAIDTFEKISRINKLKNFDSIWENWKRLAHAEDYKKLTEGVLRKIHKDYWLPEIEKTKRSFLRIFWEKADYDDKNDNAAFHRRQTDKMKLRGRQQKIDLEAYKKFYDFWTHQFAGLDILQDMYEREIKKQEIIETEKAIFNLEFK